MQPKVHHMSHGKLDIYYFSNRGIKRGAAQITSGNGRAEFDQDSFVALQEQKGRTQVLKNSQALYNELKALYLKQQETKAKL